MHEAKAFSDNSGLCLDLKLMNDPLSHLKIVLHICVHVFLFNSLILNLCIPDSSTIQT